MEYAAMITVTRLNGRMVVVNAELIKFVEATPDTLITLTSGEHFMVKEKVDDIVERAVEYARRVRSFQIV
jgi:flagellar protein FlbD